MISLVGTRRKREQQRREQRRREQESESETASESSSSESESAESQDEEGQKKYHDICKDKVTVAGATVLPRYRCTKWLVTEVTKVGYFLNNNNQSIISRHKTTRSLMRNSRLSALPTYIIFLTRALVVVGGYFPPPP